MGYKVIRLNRNRNGNWNANWNNLANSNGNGRMAQIMARLSMKTYTSLYSKITSIGNLELAWRKARKGKTALDYVIEFERNLEVNIVDLRIELLKQDYLPKPLKTFVLRDPKIRKISKSEFIDRIVHHAIVIILEPIY